MKTNQRPWVERSTRPPIHRLPDHLNGPASDLLDRYGLRCFPGYTPLESLSTLLERDGGYARWEGLKPRAVVRKTWWATVDRLTREDGDVADSDQPG